MERIEEVDGVEDWVGSGFDHCNREEEVSSVSTMLP